MESETGPNSLPSSSMARMLHFAGPVRAVDDPNEAQMSALLPAGRTKGRECSAARTEPTSAARPSNGRQTRTSRGRRTKSRFTSSRLALQSCHIVDLLEDPRATGKSGTSVPLLE